MGGANLTAKEKYQQNMNQLPAQKIGMGVDGAMLAKDTIEEISLPDGTKYVGGGEMPYYGDEKPMVVPKNNQEPLRNVEYIRAESEKPLSETEKMTKQNEGVLYEQFSTEFANPDTQYLRVDPTRNNVSVSEFMKAKTYKKPKGMK